MPDFHRETIPVRQDGIPGFQREEPCRPLRSVIVSGRAADDPACLSPIDRGKPDPCRSKQDRKEVEHLFNHRLFALELSDPAEYIDGHRVVGGSLVCGDRVPIDLLLSFQAPLEVLEGKIPPQWLDVDRNPLCGDPEVFAEGCQVPGGLGVDPCIEEHDLPDRLPEELLCCFPLKPKACKMFLPPREHARDDHERPLPDAGIVEGGREENLPHQVRDHHGRAGRLNPLPAPAPKNAYPLAGPQEPGVRGHEPVPPDPPPAAVHAEWLCEDLRKLPGGNHRSHLPGQILTVEHPESSRHPDTQSRG